MTEALEAAECGKQVILTERNTSFGGRTALLYRYFPKMCHPTCGLEINLRPAPSKGEPQPESNVSGRGHFGDRDAGRLQRHAQDFAAVRQSNQSEINKKQGTKFSIPVVYYSQLMSVAYGGNAKQAGLDGHVIQPRKLQDIAGK